LNFKIIYDADLIVNLEEQQKEKKTKRERLTGIIDKKMFTDTGKRIAREILLGGKK
jgi:hypothetical protein